MPDGDAALDPRASLFDEGRRFPLCQPEPLRQLFVDCELERVEARERLRAALAIRGDGRILPRARAWG